MKFDPAIVNSIAKLQIKRPWWPLFKTTTVRILFYADGSVQFDGGPFLGLKQVLHTLAADPFPWIRFSVTTAHRSGDPSADHENVSVVDALATGTYDEVWIYSISATPIPDSDRIALDAFMDGGGGVLITGDHANLGAAFGGVKRAGAMRLLPAPDSLPPEWNTTLESGDDNVYEFNDQSDSTPQKLRLRRYGSLIKWHPHPVLCSPLGPITIFPDHQHEGEAVAPTPDASWPDGMGAQVIAWGKIKDPDADEGREIGVLSAYDGHLKGVGRVLADATWHHHFDINLVGFANADMSWKTEAEKIAWFFWNAAIWLARPERQEDMQCSIAWALCHDPELVEIFGASGAVSSTTAVNAFGRIASPCMVRLFLPIRDFSVWKPPIRVPEWLEPDALLTAELVNGIMEHTVGMQRFDGARLREAIDVAIEQAPKRAARTFQREIGALKGSLDERLSARSAEIVRRR